eukprot:CAMPEP_0172091278 /NCGR_PEP_ID=MMETSP1043-20130122/24817_1 /TAXON_ID=464988 /ORGANISM="Hemiselmis andersenii, Strain CCMP441" /LENGTH=47 /DNA_ID= /DNA_START= /DNA_END= /DNA_ORIENTATION=
MTARSCAWASSISASIAASSLSMAGSSVSDPALLVPPCEGASEEERL